MIELGLGRITRLLHGSPMSWRAIHVAGTNGKGSVCAYISAMLNAGEVKCGRFTSPHLMDRWDCISINGQTIRESTFREVEAVVKAKDQREDINASEFELLTATAFEIFEREKIEFGVVEVGLGGRDDATNVIQHPSVTIITKIGKDHQAFLGTTMEEIAYHKAGIMKRNVPCFVDGTNSPSVAEVFRHNAQVIEPASLVFVSQNPDSDYDSDGRLWRAISKENLENHQQMNLRLAIAAVNEVLLHSHPHLPLSQIASAVRETIWPGRLQTLNIRSLTGREKDILLDGAHNVSSAEVLGNYVDRHLRQSNCPVTWVLAVSKGKEVQEMLAAMLRKGDNVISTSFSPVDGMPWVASEEVDRLSNVFRSLLLLEFKQKSSENVEDALRLATKVADGGPMVVAGSLYLVSDVLRLLRKVGKTQFL